MSFQISWSLSIREKYKNCSLIGTNTIAAGSGLLSPLTVNELEKKEPMKCLTFSSSSDITTILCPMGNYLNDMKCVAKWMTGVASERIKYTFHFILLDPSVVHLTAQCQSVLKQIRAQNQWCKVLTVSNKYFKILPQSFFGVSVLYFLYFWQLLLLLTPYISLTPKST